MVKTTPGEKVYFDSYEEAYVQACEEIDRLKAYCGSAAQALYEVKLRGAYRFRYDKLIDELEKISQDQAEVHQALGSPDSEGARGN